MNIKKYTKEQKGVIIVSVLTSFLTTFMGSALNLSIPDIGSEFGAGAAIVSWIVTVYMLTCAVLAIPVGILSDKIASKIILCAGLFVFLVANVLLSFCSQIYLFLAFRFVQAVGASMIFATNIAILVASFGKEEKGKVIGVTTAANYFGLLAGPVLGGWINYYLGWRYIFVLSAVISTVSLIVALKRIPIGGVRIKAKNIGLKDIKLVIVNKGFACASLAALINYGAVFGTNYLMSIYLQSVKGYDSKWAGIILIVAPAVQVTFSFVSGKLSDKVPPHKVSAVAMIVSCISIGILSFIDVDTSLYMLIGGMILVGFGSAFFSAPNTNAVMSSVEEERYSLASSILATMRSFGHTISMWIVTFFTKINIGDMPLNEANPVALIEIISISLYFFIGLCIIGFFIALKGKS